MNAKGSLVTLDAGGAARDTIVFQYNPDTLTRRIEPRAIPGQEGGREDALRVPGPPRETISLTIEIDGTNALERSDQGTLAEGILPSLAALELLLYPSADRVAEAERLAQQGQLEIVPPEAPLVLFTWGERRSIPVRVTAVSVVEEAHDARLSPIRAKVELTLSVLSSADVPPQSQAHALFMTYHRAKEGLARRRPPPGAL
jgi:hypothetical protein